ncbi:MAG: hypothetical protein IJU51_00665 [Clostridia bacterium]|nr:hypothetical protein [Clostridia bacterium]
MNNNNTNKKFASNNTESDIFAENTQAPAESAADTDTAPDDIPEYDPYTGMFSENPYDLNTGKFIQKKKELPKPAVDYKNERKNKILAFGIMTVITTPIVIALYYSSTTVLKPFLEFNYFTVLLGFIFLGFLAVCLGSYLIIRYNNSFGTNSKRKIDSRVFYMGLPSSLLCATLVTPEYSYVGNVVCIALLLASLVSFVIIFSKKLSLGSRSFCTIALLIVAAICFGSGAYEKLFLHPFEMDSEYIILTKRPEDQLPPETDRRVFISTSINVEKQSYNEYTVKDYETFCDIISKDKELDRIYPMSDLTTTPGREMNDMIKEKMRERENRFNREFFTTHDLRINIQTFPQYVNDVHIVNANICRTLVVYNLKVDYTEPVRNHYFPVDVGIEFIIVPKNSLDHNNYTNDIIENVTGQIYREAA